MRSTSAILRLVGILSFYSIVSLTQSAGQRMRAGIASAIKT